MKQGQGLSCADAIRRSFSNFDASHMAVGCASTAPQEKWHDKGRNRPGKSEAGAMVPRKVSQEVDACAPGCRDFGVTTRAVAVDFYEKPPCACDGPGVSGLWRSGRVGWVALGWTYQLFHQPPAVHSAFAAVANFASVLRLWVDTSV